MEAKNLGNIYSAARSTIAASRFSELKELFKDDDSCNPAGALLLVSDGTSTSVAGHGDVFKNFLQTRRLTGYIGEGERLVSVYDDGYDEAKLKLIRFDQTFTKLSYDASKREFFPFSLAMFLPIFNYQSPLLCTSIHLRLYCEKLLFF